MIVKRSFDLLNNTRNELNGKIELHCWMFNSGYVSNT